MRFITNTKGNKTHRNIKWYSCTQRCHEKSTLRWMIRETVWKTLSMWRDPGSFRSKTPLCFMSHSKKKTGVSDWVLHSEVCSESAIKSCQTQLWVFPCSAAQFPPPRHPTPPTASAVKWAARQPRLSRAAGQGEEQRMSRMMGAGGFIYFFSSLFWGQKSRKQFCRKVPSNTRPKLERERERDKKQTRFQMWM